MTQKCDFSSDGASASVVICGHPEIAKVVPGAMCASCRFNTVPRDCREKSRGLGDTAAKALSLIGVTPERVTAVAAVFGISDCGCEERKEALNRTFPYA